MFSSTSATSTVTLDSSRRPTGLTLGPELKRNWINFEEHLHVINKSFENLSTWSPLKLPICSSRTNLKGLHGQDPTQCCNPARSTALMCQASHDHQPTLRQSKSSFKVQPSCLLGLVITVLLEITCLLPFLFISSYFHVTLGTLEQVFLLVI